MKSIVQTRSQDLSLVPLSSLNLPTLKTRKDRSMNLQQMIACFSFCLLAWSTLAVAPTFAQTITHEPLLIFNSDSTNDGFGRSVSGAGDVNSDGCDDLIVGAALGGSGSAGVLSGVDGSVLYDFDGDSAGDLFGLAVGGDGDINGDGFGSFAGFALEIIF